MSELKIFFTEEITEQEKDRLRLLVEMKSSHLPGSSEDYVLVQRPYGSLNIRFFQKGRVDEVCRNGGMDPEDFIFGLFKSCAGESCKFHREEELKRNHRQKFHSPNDLSNVCRVCKEYLEEGVARYNDYGLMRYDKDTIFQPICNFCSDNNPDKQHKKYLKHPLVTRHKS